MALTDFTTYDKVRAALGVSEEEIPDSVLALDSYEDDFLLQAYAIDFTLIDTYNTLKVLVSPTFAQQNFLICFRLFATYTVAFNLCPALPSFSPRLLSDGEASYSRHDQSYKDIEIGVGKLWNQYKSALIEANGAITTPAAETPFSPLVISAPSYDPVTG